MPTTTSAMSVATNWKDLCLRTTDLTPIKDIIVQASTEMSMGDPLFLLAVEDWKAGRVRGIENDIYKYFIEGTGFEGEDFIVNIEHKTRLALDFRFKPSGRIRSGVPILLPHTVFDVAYREVEKLVNDQIIGRPKGYEKPPTSISKRRYAVGKELMVKLCRRFLEYFY